MIHPRAPVSQSNSALKVTWQQAPATTSDAVLEGLHAVGLHDGLRRSCFHFLHLAEDQLGACLRGRLLLRLDHDQPWDREFALRHLALSELRERIQHLRALRLLVACCRCECLRDAAVWQSLHALRLHGLHSLHGLHYGYWTGNLLQLWGQVALF